MHWISGDTKIEYRFLNFDDEILYKESELSLAEIDVDRMLLNNTYLQWVVVFTEDGTQCVKAFGTKRDPIGQLFGTVSVLLCLKRMGEDGRITS